MSEVGSQATEFEGDSRSESIDESLALIRHRVGELVVDHPTTKRGRAKRSTRAKRGKRGEGRRVLLDVLELVVVRDGDVSTIGDEVVHLDFSESVRLDREGEFDEILDRLHARRKDVSFASTRARLRRTHVLNHPLETRVVRRIDDLEVLENG